MQICNECAHNARFDVLTAVMPRIQVFLYAVLCCYISSSLLFKGSYHIHGRDQGGTNYLTYVYKVFVDIKKFVCGNKMPTRCNRGFYCRPYCLLNMFQAPLGSWGLCFQFAGCCSILQTRHITLSSTSDQQLENHSTKYHRQQPLYNTLELLMMGIMVPKTCWASNICKICNKNLCCI